jgi:hypothetical protein
VRLVLLLSLAGTLALAGTAVGATPEFRYERSLTLEGSAPYRVVADARLAGHARDGFADVRIFDAEGQQVPWRLAPETPQPQRAAQPVDLLGVGRENGQIVALIDFGPERVVRTELELVIPGKDFVGNVTVLGGDDRARLRQLSRVAVWDIRGATRSRSTTVTFPPSDLRYLELRARGIPGLTGATVSSQAALKRAFEPWTVANLRRDERGHRTVIRADLGLELPVEAVSITGGPGPYDRSVALAGSTDGRLFFPLGSGRLFRYTGASNGRLEVAARVRFVRLTVFNGDDVPLRDVRIGVEHEPRVLLVRGSGAPPFTVRYGAALQSPSYEFARLPVSALGLPRAGTGALGPEVNITREVAEPRSYRWLVSVGLAFAALAVGLLAMLVLRRTTPK